MGLTADALYDNIMLDLPPDSIGQRADFGLATRAHYDILNRLVRGGEIARDQLRAVSCDGPAITALVRSCPSCYDRALVFRTMWDGLAGEDEEE